MTGELSPKAGARVVVHASDEHPAVVQFGMDAQPGTAGSISMQMVSAGDLVPITF